MKAIVCKEFGPPSKLVLEDMEPLSPKKNEILIDIHAAGVNFPDTLIIKDMYQFKPALPFTPGNEGAGVVIEIGEGVTSLEVGDHVIPLYTPECRECEYCLNPKTNLCQKIRSTQGAGVMPDGTSRFSMMDGTPILKRRNSPSARYWWRFDLRAATSKVYGCKSYCHLLV